MSAPFSKEIADCCRQLRLSSNLAERSASTPGETNQEYLYHLLRDEVEYRRKQRISKLLKSAGFPAPYDFSQFRADEVEFQSGCSVESLQSGEFYDKDLNIIMFGGTVLT